MQIIIAIMLASVNRRVSFVLVAVLMSTFLSLTSVSLADDVGDFSKLPKILNTKIYSSVLISSGQPHKQQFSAIANASVQVVINLAPKNLPASIKNEGDIVRAQGMEYFFIPVDWVNPSQNDFDEFLEIMDGISTGENEKATLVHCWVNGRSSVFAYLYGVLRKGKDEKSGYDEIKAIWGSDEIKDMIKGYEFHNSPQWQKFIKDALARHS